MTKKQLKRSGLTLAVGASALLAACNSGTRNEQSAVPEAPALASEGEATEGMRAEADIEGADGSEIEGKATFVQEPDGVRVVVEVEDAPPGMKGVHVHQHGDCSDIENESMGSHFAPEEEQHALPSEGEARHLGDLGNLEVDSSGKGRLEIKVERATLEPGNELSFLGRALIVHSGQDSGSSTQPSGGSGTPMACGVIERKEG